MWFRWQGKPLLICDPKEATSRGASSSSRCAGRIGRSRWRTRQTPGIGRPLIRSLTAYTDDPQRPEQVNVSVAQNFAPGMAGCRQHEFRTGARAQLSRRRTTITAGSVNHGYNFQEQWERAFELNPPFVMVTGWNEWIAGRWGKPDETAGVRGPIRPGIQPRHRADDAAGTATITTGNWSPMSAATRARLPLPKASPPKTIRSPAVSINGATCCRSLRIMSSETMPRDFDGVGGHALHQPQRAQRLRRAAKSRAIRRMSISTPARASRSHRPPARTGCGC